MKKTVWLAVVAAVAASLAGCASDFRYTQPGIYRFQNQTLIEADFNQVWERLQKNLPSGFFAKTNVDKDARLLSLSFSSDKPSDFVDCGRTDRYFSNEKGRNQYSYNPADSAVYTIRSGDDSELNAIRNAKLKGETNLYLAPHASGTMLTVNTKYVIDVNIKYYDFNNQHAGSDDFTFAFTSETDFIEPGIICTAKGNLERKIMSYAE